MNEDVLNQFDKFFVAYTPQEVEDLERLTEAGHRPVEAGTPAETKFPF